MKNPKIKPKLAFLIFAFVFNTFNLIAINSLDNPNKTYYVKYILDENGYAINSESTITITPNRIYVTRNGKDKYWDCVYKGTKVDEPAPGKKVIFHIYYLTNSQVYLVVSDYKLVKHNGVFYYRLEFDGQAQLAL